MSADAVRKAHQAMLAARAAHIEAHAAVGQGQEKLREFEDEVTDRDLRADELLETYAEAKASGDAEAASSAFEEHEKLLRVAAADEAVETTLKRRITESETARRSAAMKYTVTCRRLHDELRAELEGSARAAVVEALKGWGSILRLTRWCNQMSLLAGGADTATEATLGRSSSTEALNEFWRSLGLSPHIRLVGGEGGRADDLGLEQIEALVRKVTGPDAFEPDGPVYDVNGDLFASADPPSQKVTDQ